MFLEFHKLNFPHELQLLLKKGQVTHFVEKIPSVNDIFIKTVTD